MRRCREAELLAERDAAAEEARAVKQASLGEVSEVAATQISAAGALQLQSLWRIPTAAVSSHDLLSAADTRAKAAEDARAAAEEARASAAAAADAAAAETAEAAAGQLREVSGRAEAAEEELKEVKMVSAAAAAMSEERLAEAEQRAERCGHLTTGTIPPTR